MKVFVTSSSFTTSVKTLGEMRTDWKANFKTSDGRDCCSSQRRKLLQKQFISKLSQQNILNSVYFLNGIVLFIIMLLGRNCLHYYNYSKHNQYKLV